MESELTMRLQEILYRCQAWIDDEKYIPKKFKVKSRSDEFAEKILRELETVMIREKFCFRQEKTYLPTLYFIQISQADNLEFTGQKRDALCEELDKFVQTCFRMLSIESSRTNFIQLAVNPSLKKDEIKIVHQWEESYLPEISFSDLTKTNEFAEFEDFSETTIIAPAFWKGDFSGDDEEYETIVGKIPQSLYQLEISRHGVLKNNLPVFKNEIIIGRGSLTRPVDVRLADDLEISRQHAVLTYRSENAFNLSILGQNAAFAAGNQVRSGQTAFLTCDNEFHLGSYSLNIRRSSKESVQPSKTE